MLHTGYLFGIDPQAPVAPDGRSYSPQGALFGIGGALLLGDRWTVLDPIAGMIVGAMLIKTTVDLLRGSMNDLTDSSLPEETEQEIMSIILSVPDVFDPHNLRTRRIGNHIAIEVHVRMNGNTSLQEAHDHASLIEQKLRTQYGKHTHVNVHMEPDKHTKVSSNVIKQ